MEKRKSDETVGQLRKKMQTALGSYYDELYNYFLEIASADYDYKVLIARRCLVLYQAFLALFSADAEAAKCRDPRLAKALSQKDRVISDLATARFYSFTDSTRILLVDDIIIHGNHMWSVYQQLMLFPHCVIDTKVYMLSDCVSSRNIPQSFWVSLQCSSKSRHGEWMELSNRIVNAIYCSSIPYISHLSVYRMSKDVSFAAYCSDLTEIENENLAQKQLGCKSHVLFCKKPRLPFFETVSFLDCLRVYGNRWSTLQTVIPYSFTKPLRAETHKGFFQLFADYLPANMQHTKSQFAECKDSPDWSLYQMRLFKAIVSQMYLVSVLHHVPVLHQTGTDIQACPFALEKSFDSDIAREFQEMTYASIESLLKEPHKNWTVYFCDGHKEMPEFSSIWKHLCEDSSQDPKHIFLDCVWQHRMLEENRLKENVSENSYQGKYPGISVDFILNSSNDLEKMRQIATQILNANDSGCATSTYALSCDKKAYTTFLSNGEQSFRIILESYPFIVRKMIFLEERGLSVEDYLEKLFVWWAKKLDPDSLAWRKRRLKDFYQQYKGRLSDINAPSIIENTEFWTPRDVNDLLQFHKSYFSSNQ